MILLARGKLKKEEAAWSLKETLWVIERVGRDALKVGCVTGEELNPTLFAITLQNKIIYEAAILFNIHTYLYQQQALA